MVQKFISMFLTEGLLAALLLLGVGLACYLLFFWWQRPRCRSHIDPGEGGRLRKRCPDEFPNLAPTTKERAKAMRVVCIYCEKEAVPALIREKEPLDDPRVTHGICRRHQLQVREEVQALWGHLPGRRRFGRFPVSLPVTGRSPQMDGGELHGMVRTVGAGGLMVEFPVEVPPGSTVYLVLEIRLGPLPVECQVVWARATGGTVRHGLAFLEFMGRNFATDLFLEEHR